MKRCPIRKHDGSNYVLFLFVSEYFKLKVLVKVLFLFNIHLPFFVLCYLSEVRISE